jgi:hypothetical protein
MLIRGAQPLVHPCGTTRFNFLRGFHKAQSSCDSGYSLTKDNYDRLGIRDLNPVSSPVNPIVRFGSGSQAHKADSRNSGRIAQLYVHRAPGLIAIQHSVALARCLMAHKIHSNLDRDELNDNALHLPQVSSL